MRISGKDKEYPHARLTHQIIGAAIAVQQSPGPGLDEKLYENALSIELAHLGIHDAQLLSSLAITKLPLGLLLNFKVTPLGKRRLLNPHQ